jgi:hypothetical protein
MCVSNRRATIKEIRQTEDKLSTSPKWKTLHNEPIPPGALLFVGKDTVPHTVQSPLLCSSSLVIRTSFCTRANQQHTPSYLLCLPCMSAMFIENHTHRMESDKSPCDHFKPMRYDFARIIKRDKIQHQNSPGLKCIALLQNLWIGPTHEQCMHIRNIARYAGTWL